MEQMTPRRLALISLPIAALLAAVAACGGDDDGGSSNGGTGRLTDPENVATATPWPSAPSPIILDPDNLTPISGGEGIGGNGDGDGDGNGDGDGDGDGNGDGDGEPSPVPGVCGGDTYTIEQDDTIFGIAEKCGLDPQDILDANPGIDPAGLNIGDVINLPAASSEESTDGE
jgi:hypothetical protein